MEYTEALDLQHRMVEARVAGTMHRNLLLLVEHPAVLTLGRRGSREHVIVHEAFLESRGIEVVRAERGGDVTYHGPGQLVGYTIFDLRTIPMGIVDLVEALEEVMIRTLADWGIKAHRNPANRGAWVKEKKVGSVGIAIRRQVSFHGFALNVNTQLEPFSWIHPCGLEGVRVTSIKRVLGRDIPMEDVRRSAILHVEEIFRVKLEKTGLEDMGKPLNKSAKEHNRKSKDLGM